MFERTCRQATCFSPLGQGSSEAVAPTDLARAEVPTRARIILLAKVTFPIRTQARRGTERPRVTQADVRFGGRFGGKADMACCSANVCF
jgi:hypothetical protein